MLEKIHLRKRTSHFTHHHQSVISVIIVYHRKYQVISQNSSHFLFVPINRAYPVAGQNSGVCLIFDIIMYVNAI